MALAKWSQRETVCTAWIVLSAASLIPVTQLLQSVFPIFTVVWLVVPLASLLLSKNAARIGFRAIGWREFLQTAAVNTGTLLLVTALIEPWSHTYQGLVRAALAAAPPDTTFAWLLRYPGLPGWLGLLFFSGLVTIFAEELFFRGWLLQLLQRRLGMRAAIVLQAALFTLPNGIAVLLLAPLPGMLYAVVYTFVAVGLVGGWAAARTQSIWPSLATAAIWNVLVTMLVLT